MMKYKLLAVLTLFLLCTRVWGGELFAYRDSVQNGYNFLLYIPDSYAEREDEVLPVIVCLHGRSRAGHDLNMITKYGCVDALRRGTQIDAIVICPQCPTTAGWDADKVMNVIEFVYNRFRCDQDRLYIYGMSMGGWGTFKVVAEYPDRVAAAIAMCGGYTGKKVDKLGEVPLWIIHGTSDNVTRLSFSTRIVKELEETGHSSRLRCTWLEGQGHSILARTFLLQDTYDWLLQHRLSTPDRPCSQDYDVTVTDLHKAYIYLDPSKGQRLPFKKP